MLKEKWVFLILVPCILTFTCVAQVLPVYSFQKDDTLLRKNYFDQSVKKKELTFASFDKENAKSYKDIYKEQFEEIGRLWNSSRPMLTPLANGYLQSIVKMIISSNSELKGTDARVVFSRDWWPNAVSMGDGSIAINAGLVVYMNNEAELAFVICHELSHYYLDHSGTAIRKYVETVNSDSYQAELKRLSKTVYGANKQLETLQKATIFNSRRHSRDNEAAADRQALLFMKNTGYDCEAAKTCLELLDKVDDSLLYRQPDLQQIFNLPGYAFKKKWIQKESSIFSQVDQNGALSPAEKDSLKTHPDCIKRISMLASVLTEIPAPGKKFKVDQSLFNQLKKDLFLEMTEECFREKKLSRNLYYNLLLLQEGQYEPMAMYSVARCLNAIFDNQKNHRLGLVTDLETRGWPEPYNLLLRMISRLRLDELASLNYAFCSQHFERMKDYPGFEAEMSIAKKHTEE